MRRSVSTGIRSPVTRRKCRVDAWPVSFERSGVQATASLRAAGYSAGEVRRLRIGGVLHPLRRGAYAVGGLPPDPAARHALLVRASVAELSPAAVVSHVSAAVLYGLPVWAIRLDRAWVT